MANGKRPVWDQGSVFKANDGNLYIVLEMSALTVKVMRVAWMWDKDETLKISSTTDNRRRGDLYCRLRDKYTYELERRRAPSKHRGTSAAEYVILADGSTIRSTSRLGPAALKRLEDAAGVFKFRIVRATFSGPIRSPVDAIMRKYNEYSRISSDDPGNPKLHEIFGAMTNLLEEGVLPPALVEQFIAKIESEFLDFHSPLASSKAVEAWRKQRSIELIYADTVKVNQAYRKRVERYVRGMISQNVRQQNTEEDQGIPAS